MSSDRHCCVPGCKVSRVSGIHAALHGFPNPEKDKLRFNTWLYSIGGDILKLENAHIFRYRRVCHIHFEDKYVCRNNRISNIAVPTLHLPGPLHRFPKWEYPHTEKFNQWKSVLDNTVQERGNNYIYNSIRICDKHFEEYFKSSSRRLTRNAVPTLNLMAHPSSPQKAECGSDVSAMGSPTPVEPFSPSSPYDQDFAATDPLLLYQQGIQLDTNQDFSSPPPAANDQDNSKLCRVCGKDNITLIHLFSEEASHNNLVQKINKYLPIVVDLHDELPLGVCQSCATAVLNWHSLVQCCIKTDKLLASKLQHSKESVYKPNGENSTKNDDAKMRLSTDYLILILKEVLNDYFKILNVDEDNSDLMYVCQMCPENPALTSAECLYDHLIASHNKELCDKSAIETFVKENITFEEVLNNDEISDAESEKHVDIPNYYCPYCESVFSSPTRLICHLNKHVKVSIDDGVLCCNSLYSDKKSFVLHLQEKHVNKTIDTEIICKTCGSVEENAEALEIHINENHSGAEHQKKKVEPNPKCQTSIPAVCPECNKTFANKYTMLKHMESHTNVTNCKFVCDKCNKTYKSRSSLNHHHRVCHEGRLPFLCPMCGEGFPRRMARDNHVRIHTGFKPFSCQYCNKSFRAQNTLDCHIQMHLNIRKYECDLCPKRFRKRSHLNCHLKSHFRTRIGEGPCVCHVCGKQLRTPKGLQRHLTETHERQRRYICAVCTKNFANSQNLKQHARIHTGERPYVCAQCGKRFTQSGSLHVHLKTHGAQLPHACAECGARFRLRSGLARHRLRHSGERPHACSACGKAFRQRHELAAHALTHSDCKPHACDTCGSAFRQRRALRHHCRRLHAAQATHGALATHDAHATHDTRATHDALATHQPIAL